MTLKSTPIRKNVKSVDSRALLRDLFLPPRLDTTWKKRRRSRGRCVIIMHHSYITSRVLLDWEGSKGKYRS